MDLIKHVNDRNRAERLSKLFWLIATVPIGLGLMQFTEFGLLIFPSVRDFLSENVSVLPVGFWPILMFAIGAGFVLLGFFKFSRLRITTVRIIVQTVEFGLFMLFVFATSFTQLSDRPRMQFWLSKFLEIDPLVSIATAITTHTVYEGLIWSLILLVPTLFLGRFFCNWICPYGIIHQFVGFSTHTKIDLRSSLLNDSAVGWPDAIMVASDPRLVRKNSDFNKSLDACYKAGVGLICMKEMRAADEIPEVVPEFEKMGLTKYAAVLRAVWTDERFASICSHMQNLKIVKENAESARIFKPFTDDQLGMLDTVMDRYASSFCVGCDGSCAVAAGTDAALGDIVRYLSYCEMDGDRETARRLFRELPSKHRDWSGADLKAAQAACVSNIDFEDYLARAEAKLA